MSNTQALADEQATARCGEIGFIEGFRFIESNPIRKQYPMRWNVPDLRIRDSINFSKNKKQK